MPKTAALNNALTHGQTAYVEQELTNQVDIPLSFWLALPPETLLFWCQQLTSY